MRWGDVYVSAGAVALGRKEDVTAAVADGRYDPAAHEAHGYLSISVAGEDETPLDMAVEAGRAAFARSGATAEDTTLVVHATINHQGPEHVVPASYVQGETVGSAGTALEVRQACNGGMAALEVACAYLSAASNGASALVTTSDKYSSPDTDRYRSDPGGVPGDGAAALVLSRGGGVARILSTAIFGDGRFDHADLTAGLERGDRQAFLAELHKRLMPRIKSAALLQRRSVEVALADAETESSEIVRWVIPNVGRTFNDQALVKTFGIEESRTAWEWGRTVGHLSAGDQMAGLTHLLESGAVRTGDRVGLYGGGVGFSFGCAVVEIVAEPSWAA